MAYCGKCGYKNPEEAEFCGNCGSPMRRSGEAASHGHMRMPLREEPPPSPSPPPPPPPHRESEPSSNGGVVGFIKKNIKVIGIAVVTIVLLLLFYHSCVKSSDTPKSKTEKVVTANESESNVTPEPASEPDQTPEVEENIEQPTDEEPVKEVVEEFVDKPVEEPVEEPVKERFSGPVYDRVDQRPTFPGGYSVLLKYLSEKIVYPESARKDEIEGIVIMSFVVEPDGSLSNINVYSPVDPEIDKEAIRVVKNMPRWNPGKKGKKNVRVKYELPISFKL